MFTVNVSFSSPMLYACNCSITDSTVRPRSHGARLQPYARHSANFHLPPGLTTLSLWLHVWLSSWSVISIITSPVAAFGLHKPHSYTDTRAHRDVTRSVDSMFMSSVVNCSKLIIPFGLLMDTDLSHICTNVLILYDYLKTFSYSAFGTFAYCQAVYDQTRPG